MLLNEIFNEQTIKLDLESDTKAAVFTELIETMAAVHPELNKTEMLSAVMYRENKMNTAIAAGVAVPHGYYSGTDKIIGAIGISKNGIDYGTTDNKPVHFIFLLLMGDAVREEHLRILNRVLSLINSGALPSLQTAKDVREVYDILSRFR
ncbi:MAG: PTS sugar transporter subunit IIA [Spirochaetaceae bacterium]|jgi:mannitol/fructose-specific phosphotransferase system IIA component (Ntr-type)|nr:PTS sugar transporter subunit IIA [Spirochaetaceae bacterium]